MIGIWLPQHAMAEILFIKTSSLGDVIHHMPALTEARKALWRRGLHVAGGGGFCAAGAAASGGGRHYPGSLAALAKVALCAGDAGRNRRQVSAPSARATMTKLSTAKGCCVRAVIARMAHGRRHGYDAASIREPLASVFYDRPLSRRPRAACGRAQPHPERPGARIYAAGRPDFGLDRARFTASARVMRCCCTPQRGRKSNGRRRIGSTLGTASTARDQSNWCCPGARRPSARAANGSRPEVPNARVPERAPLDQVAKLIAGAQYVVGVDTGLLHLAAALGVPLVAIFTGSKPGLTGPVGSGPLSVLGENGISPSVEGVRDAITTVVR